MESSWQAARTKTSTMVRKLMLTMKLNENRLIVVALCVEENGKLVLLLKERMGLWLMEKMQVGNHA